MTAPRVCGMVLVALLGAACSSVRTQYDFDPTADFSAWRSFAWFPPGSVPSGDPRLDNPLLLGRIESAVNEKLQARGFVLLQDREPDFWVQIHLSTEQRLDVRTMNTGYVGGPRGAGWRGGGWAGTGWTETRVEQYEEGTLVIDFVDAARRRLVWRGSGTRRLARNIQPDRVTQRVNEAVEEILAQFPPQTE